MNIPLNTLRRDELYTFVGGIVVGSAWYLYFQKINMIGDNKNLIDPAFVLTWLCQYSVAIYLLHSLISGCDRNQQPTNQKTK